MNQISDSQMNIRIGTTAESGPIYWPYHLTDRALRRYMPHVDGTPAIRNSIATHLISRWTDLRQQGVHNRAVVAIDPTGDLTRAILDAIGDRIQDDDVVIDLDGATNPVGVDLDVPANHDLLTAEMVIRDNEKPPAGADYVSDDTDTTATIAVGESWLHGNPVPGRIEGQNDQDWYLTNLRAGRCYQIEIRGKSDAEYELPGAEGLTLTDPYLNGVYRDDGVYLPGTTNRDGGTDLSALHTIRFNRTGAYYIAVSHGWYDEGGTFDLSVHNLGTRTKTCTEVDVDNLTYKPGTFDSK